MQSDRETELIKLLYTLAVEPQHLHVFLSEIDGMLEELYENGNDPSHGLVLERFDQHISTANELLDRHGSAQSSAALVEHSIDIDARPALMLAPDLRVRHLNRSAKTEFGLELAAPFAAGILTKDEYVRLRKIMRSLKDAGTSRYLGIFQLLGDEGVESERMVLSQTTDKDGQPVGHLATLRVSWQTHTGEAFRDAFNLTAAEEMIVATIVNGRSLEHLAKTRGTALGTVRNQTKHLLRKLNLHSQTELVCLFAGFSHVSPLPRSLGTSHFPEDGMGGARYFFARSDGSQLEYEVFGSPQGKPVLFFHPLIGGTGLTKKQKTLISQYNLRLIMPWLPLFKGTQDRGHSSTIASRYAHDLDRLLTHLGIAESPVLCFNTSVIYGLSFAKEYAQRVTKIVSGNGAVPLIDRGQFAQISVQQRIPYYIARHFPWLLDFYIKSVKAKLERGYEVEYVEKYFEESPLDVQTILDPEVRMIASQSIAFAFENGHQSVVNHVRLVASNWMDMLKSCPVPIEMYSGIFDSEYTAEMVEVTVQDMPQVTFNCVDDAGALIWYQKPECLLSQL